MRCKSRFKTRLGFLFNPSELLAGNILNLIILLLSFPNITATEYNFVDPSLTTISKSTAVVAHPFIRNTNAKNRPFELSRKSNAIYLRIPTTDLQGSIMNHNFPNIFLTLLYINCRSILKIKYHLLESSMHVIITSTILTHLVKHLEKCEYTWAA